MSPTRTALRYEGKAKKVFGTTDPARYIVEYKDDATAFNAQKRGTVKDKGVVNAAVSAHIFEFLARAGVPTHFEELLSPREQLVRAVTIVPLEVVVRNRAAGSFAQRYGVPEGGELFPVVVEWCLKNDALGDPPINDAAAVALGIVSPEDLEEMFELTVEVNELLKPYFAARGLDLVDFKLEFGLDDDGNVVLADEISPDTCRLWDASTGEKLDKDRFRRDLGGVEEAYQEVLRRVSQSVEGDDEIVARHVAGRDHELGHGHGEHDGDGHAHGEHAHDDHGHGEHAHYEQAHGEHVRGLSAGRTLRAEVDVMLRPSILDPQGRAVEATLHRLGHGNVSNVRIGKRISLDASGDRGAVLAQVEQLAKDLLSNPVMEDVTVMVEGGEG
ncbi:MAG: phosphoribosylaminoimidazolesuccinocarboxamide synthase [Truepera sp.]|nr:phosphoribosylaminoimidazolesuccinocarboxamide synthase [Truepera sp.]